MAISGLHVGIAFGFGYWLGFLLIRLRCKLALLPLLVGFACAAGYAWLAGFSLTTQRALILISILLLLRLFAIHTSYRYKWLLMVSALLLFDPFAVYSNSFWLSVIAVALVFILLGLFSTYQGKKSYSKLKQLVGLQIGLVLLMTPVVALTFHGIGLVSVAYNLIFVPWFSFWVIPLILTAVALLVITPSLSAALFELASLSLVPLVKVMPFSESLWLPISASSAWWLLCIVIVWLCRRGLSPRFVLLLSCSILMSFSMLFLPEQNKWRLHVLDVGHGLAAVIERNGKATLFDTGASWGSGDYVSLVVIPFLRANDLRLEQVIVSHFDNDHAGGLASLMSEFPRAKLFASQTEALPDIARQPCVKGQSWQWQELTFVALWPPQLVERAYNPHSCVVRVEASREQSLLLTGDIEVIAEWTLTREPQQLSASVVLVPHHGSATSSMARFVRAVDPHLAIASNAFQGRWSLPNAEVKQRYLEQGANWMDTGNDGQISVTFDPGMSANKIAVAGLRATKGKAWYRQMLRKRVE